MISPSVRSRKHVLRSQDAEEIDGNRHQVEIGQNKSTIFSNNLEILFLELGNSVLKYCFFELGKGQVRTLVENVLIPQVGNRHQVEIGQNKSTIFRNNLEI